MMRASPTGADADAARLKSPSPTSGRDTGVVVLSYGSGGEYEDLLHGLFAAGVAPSAVVVVHNPAAPGQPPVSVPAGCELVQPEHNLGFSGGMNLGIERQLARGVDQVLVLTHDARLRPGALEALLGAAARSPRYGVLGPALAFRGSEEPFSYGAITRANGSVTHVRRLSETPEGGLVDCDWIDGGAMLLRASMLRLIGSFDDRYFMYCEDADLCLRAQRAGYRVGVVIGALAEQAPGGEKRLGPWAYLITRNGLEYARSARGARGVLFMATRSLSQAAVGIVRAGARGAGLRAGDPMEPWSASAGALIGIRDFLGRRWGPPPKLPGPGDVRNTVPRRPAGDLPRVLHLGPDPAIGGGMASALRGLLASPLVDRYRLDVVATYRGPEPWARIRTFAAALLRLVAWRLRRRGRLVHVHAAARGSLYRKSVYVLVAKALGSRVILHVHAGPGDVEEFAGRAGRTSHALFRRAFRAADVSAAVSSASARSVERAFGAADVAVLPNSAPRMEAAAHAAAGNGASALYLGGFADPAKGGDDLLAALAVALASEADLRVVLAGPGDLPDAGRELLDRHPAGRWSGWLGDAERNAALLEADIFVLASRSEGLPMALLEAMATGLAIAATEVGGVPEVLEDDRDALLVPAGDPAALAAAIVRLAGDPSLRARLGAAARGRAAELDAGPVSARLDEIYSSLLGG